MGKVYNKSTLLVEKATLQVCPRCKGVGANFHDDDNCFLCKGRGTLWLSDSGWTRPLYQKLEKSQLY